MVGKRFLLIKSNFRKSIKELIAIVLLFIASSLILNVFLTVNLDYKKTFDRNVSKLNSEDAISVLYNPVGIDAKDQLRRTLDGIDYVDSYEIDEAFVGYGTVKFVDGLISNPFSFLPYSEVKNKSIGKYELLEEVEGSGVFPSYFLKVSGGYKVGDEISINFFGSTYTYTIRGFYNNVSTGSVNCPDTSYIVTDDIYNELKSTYPTSYKLCIKFKEGSDLDECTSNVNSAIKSTVGYLVVLDSTNLNTLRTTRYSNATLFETILSVSSVIMISVLIIIIIISISNYISSNIREIGTLKAIGYSSTSIILSVVIEFLQIATVASILGALISYAVIPFISTGLDMQVGIPYTVKFVPLSFAITIATTIAVTLLVTYFSLIRIKRISPINAIRNVSKDKPNKSLVKLEKSRLGVNTSLGLKSGLSNLSRNLIIILSSIAVGFLSGFSCSIYQSIVIEQDKVVQLICGQIEDSFVFVSKANEESLKNELNNNPDVASYFLYSYQSITPVGTTQLMAFAFDDENKLNKDTLLVEGRLPRTDSEIAINIWYSDYNHLSIGDKMHFNVGDATLEFDVVGYTQGAYFAGEDCYLLRDGLDRLADPICYQYYIDLKDGVTIDEFNNELASKVSLLNTVDQREYLKSMVGVYIGVLGTLVVVLVAISIIIIGFVLYIIISIMLNNKKKENGILKAIGFTSNELMYQTMISIIPWVAISLFIGLFISKSNSVKIISVLLRSIGIASIGSPTALSLILLAGGALTLFTILLTWLLSNSIKKITPHELFNGE